MLSSFGFDAKNIACDREEKTNGQTAHQNAAQPSTGPNSRHSFGNTMSP
jgi:hypothetical protein